jgi:hypothetical protein
MRFSLVALLALALLGCSEDPKPAAKKAPAAPPAPISGRQAFQYVYGSARLWAGDAQPLSVRSIPVDGVKSEPGKAEAWEAIFVSETNASARSYTWSAVENESVHQGVFPGSRQRWSPGGAEKPYVATEVKIDTPEALEIATKASDEFLKKPGSKPPVNFLLDVSGRFPGPTWKVMWGNTISSAEYVVTVDAISGKLLSKE